MAAVILRRISSVLSLLVVASVLIVTGPSAPAMADPEGGSKTLRDALESAAKGQADAIQKLSASKKRQTELQKTVIDSQASAKALESQVSVIANRSYRLGRTSTMAMLLDASSPDTFLERVQHLDMLAQLDGQVLTQYRDDLARATAAKTAIDAEIKEQQKQVTALTKKKKEAELALGSRRRRWRGRRLPQRQLAAGQAGAAQRGRLLAQGVVHGRRPDHLRLHHAAPAARLPGGPGGRIQALHVLLQPTRLRRTSQGPGVRLLGERDYVQERGSVGQ